MDTAHINTATLRNLLKLTEQRDALLGELKKIEAVISGTLSGRTAAPASTEAAPKATRKVRRRRRSTSAARKKATASPKAKAPKAPKAPKAAKKASTRKSSGKRGMLKTRILNALEKAGSKGASVKDLSKDLGVKSQNVHVWFSSTGKKLKEIHKIAPGVYRLNS